MKITVSDIPEEGIELELNEQVSSDALKILSPVKGILRIDKKAREVIIKGVINGEVEQQCSRCLNLFSTHIRTQVNIVYHPAEDIAKEYHHELRGEDLDTGFYKNDELDTDDLLREQLFLNLPMKPLCSAQCKGLCPKCGIDRNTSQCDCENLVVDERLAILKQLLERKE